MSNEVKPRTKEAILNDIKIVKDRIKPQHEEVENYTYNVRPELVKEKKEIEIKLETSDYVLDDVKRFSELYTELYENQPIIKRADENELIELYKELANLHYNHGGKRRKTKRKSFKKKKSKTMKKKAKKSMKK